MNVSPAVCTVRRAGRDDLLALLGVHARRDTAGSVPERASDLQRETWARMSGDDNMTVYLAELDGEAVGTATVVLLANLTYDCAPSALVEAVVVVAGHRRKGIATALLERILDDTRSAGCNKVQLLSHKRHAADGAHRLYEALGFEPEAEGFRRYHRHVPAAVQAARSTTWGEG